MPYHFNSSLLDPGAVIRPGNWGRILRIIGPSHTEWLRESLLEQVRQNEFSNLPSRLECAFVCDTLEEALHYRTKARLSVLYEVDLLDPDGAEHEADWQGTGPYDDTLEWTRRYWRGDVMPGRGPSVFCREKLTLSRLKVLREVSSKA